MTIDGGQTFATDAALVTHDDVHAIWINPGNSEHLLIGNDGGLAVSYDMSKTWTFLPNLPVGLFYHVSYDMETPFNVCGGMQDNYNWCGPSASRMNRGIMNYDWFQIQGGDGFVAMPDLRDSRIVYRIAGREPDPPQQSDRRIEIDSPHTAERDTGAGARRDVPLPLGHADDPFAERSRRAAGRGESRFQIDESRRHLDGDQP
jgi:hypothetical protein